MRTTLLSIALISSLALGCGRSAAMSRAKAPTEKPAVAAEASEAVAATTTEEDQGPPFSAPPPPEAAPEPALVKVPDVTKARMPGDFVVHRFSGSFREKPITLTQRVNAREGNTLVVDITFEEGDAKKVLRVRMDDSPGRRGEVLRVSLLEGNREKPSSVALYERLMARTALGADENEALLKNEAVTIDVGGAAMAATKRTYRVRLGGREGTLSTFQSDGFAWGDLGGDITSVDGDVIYKAELVDAGHAESPRPEIARSDYDDYE